MTTTPAQIDASHDFAALDRIAALGYANVRRMTLVEMLTARGLETHQAQWVATVGRDMTLVRGEVHDDDILAWFQSYGRTDDERLRRADRSCVESGRQSLAEIELHRAQAREVDELYRRAQDGEIPVRFLPEVLDALRQSHELQHADLMHSHRMIRAAFVASVDRAAA